MDSALLVGGRCDGEIYAVRELRAIIEFNYVPMEEVRKCMVTLNPQEALQLVKFRTVRYKLRAAWDGSSYAVQRQEGHAIYDFVGVF